MKIFVSWSGVRSRFIAESLYWLLPNVIQSITPFISSYDISKGSRGISSITEQLAGSVMGIVCLTPENLDNRWILFEAGALSNNASTRVCTFLHDLLPADIELPLGQFQHTQCEKDEVFVLISNLNELAAAELRLPQNRLHATFEMWWPLFVDKLSDLPSLPESEPLTSKRTVESKLDEIIASLRPKQVFKPSDLTPYEVVARLDKIKVSNGRPVWDDSDRWFCEQIGYAQTLQHEGGFETFPTHRGDDYFRRIGNRG